MVSIDIIVEDLEKNFQTEFDREECISFLKRQSRQGFVNEKEARDLYLLSRYIIGKKFIIDGKTGKKRKIKKGRLEDLVLLSYTNIRLKKGTINNTKLFNLSVRFLRRRKNNRRCLNYGQALDRIFNDKSVKEYLGGKASYNLHVCRIHNEEEDLAELMKYVLGKRFIIDAKKRKRRKIRKGILRDLALLSYTNISAKEGKGKYYNLELYRMKTRFSNRYAKNRRYLNYSRALDRIFKDKKVKAYLKAKASYKLHVYTHNQKNDIEELMKYVLGRKSIFDREAGRRRKIRRRHPEDLALLNVTNLSFKVDGDLCSQELYQLWARYSKRHSREKRNLSYGQALNKAFRKMVVLRYFGIKPSYKEHVTLKLGRRPIRTA